MLWTICITLAQLLCTIFIVLTRLQWIILINPHNYVVDYFDHVIPGSVDYFNLVAPDTVDYFHHGAPDTVEYSHPSPFQIYCSI